jgi:hypothetical protein
MDDSSIQTEMENGSTAAITFNNPTLHTYTTYPSEHSFGTKVESMINRIRRRRLQGLFIIMLVAHAFVRVEAIAVRADALNSRRHIIQKSSPDVIQRKQNQRRLPKRSSGEFCMIYFVVVDIFSLPLPPIFLTRSVVSFDRRRTFGLSWMSWLQQFATKKALDLWKQCTNVWLHPSQRKRRSKLWWF